MSQSTEITHDAEIAKLLAKRRQALDRDGFIDDHDDTNDDGDKITYETVPAGPDDTKEIEINLTKMYQAAPSTTGDIEMLVLEAELVADGTALDNPHVPADEETLRQARQQIEQNGHTPAWEGGL